jgi:hypothetical protein
MTEFIKLYKICYTICGSVFLVSVFSGLVFGHRSFSAHPYIHPSYSSTCPFIPENLSSSHKATNPGAASGLIGSVLNQLFEELAEFDKSMSH